MSRTGWSGAPQLTILASPLPGAGPLCPWSDAHRRLPFPAMGEEWRLVDEGWGRAAVEFATLSEPGNCREYVALHQELGIRQGERVLDMACGSGLAIELVRARGAIGTGIDASPRLIAIAQAAIPTRTSG